MARPIGSRNLKAGKTFFFTVDDQANQAVKHQVSIHHTTSGHWDIIHYINGDKQGNTERVTLATAVYLSGLSEEEFDMLYERTASASWMAQMSRKAQEVYKKHHI